MIGSTREPFSKENGKMVKLRRAQGGCLGTGSRRRAQQSAKSHGKPKAGIDPWVPEWGNPAGRSPVTVY